MPTARNGDVDLFYETGGGDDPDAETVAFCPEAGLGAWLWGWQAPALAGPYRTVVWDPRGTGRSDSRRGSLGRYDVTTLAADLEAVLAAADARSAHLVGCGLGAMVALAHVKRYGRARSMTLVNAAASGDVVDTAALERLFGDDWPEVAFSAAYREALAEGRAGVELDEIAGWRRADDAGPDARAAQFAALRAFDAGPLYEYDIPALVLSALDDPIVPASAGEALADGLPRATFEPMAGRHLAFVEHSVGVTDRIDAFLADPSSAGGTDRR